ncbi:RNA exonuclease 1 homolog isoform X1 [Falco biarmicus]|uniref:RNA exonuclease 1 homolog isoform X1 n=1 Tax=Falco cherrug TaxID=345164 RepID=UPI00247914AA|nr:RNA exonuclease 1 homolog isoform X1 [Falco cherrug]XP_056191665.1 RNA exonuclease 1 homolog isoform X1 [Falco biarmicus]
MLRSTGYFRGIDCPFLSAGGPGPGGGPPCRRPYCHFRHPPVAAAAAARCGASGGPGAGLALGHGAERGYDPYNPELPRPSLEAEDGTLADIADVTPGILELELVNKAIEAVKNEVEREQKKYEELLETTKEFSASEASSLISNTPVSAAGTQNDSFTSLEYNPGSYSFNNNSDYNPTPLAAASQSSKYTLDTSRSKGSSLEYVPKSVVQNKKYSSTVTNNKYVIDDSKPSTDLEYDPLSNYSARLLSKATTKDPKGSKRGRVPSYEESYSPSRKKLCEVPDDYEVCARFSSSEDEADVEYKPTSVSSQSKAGSESESNDGLSNKEQSTKLDGAASQDSKEAAVQYGGEDLPSSQKNLAKNLSDKNAKAGKLCSGKNDQEIENKNKDSKDKTKRKKSDVSKPGLSDVGKKEKSKNTGKEKVLKKEDKLKTKNEEKNCKDKSVRLKTDGNLKKPEKQKSEKVDGLKKEKSKSASSSSGKSKSESVVKGSSPEKLGSSKKDSKLKTDDVKNGKETSGRKNKEKGTKTSALERKKEKVSSTGKGDLKKGQKQQSLSHVDLFGDESGDDDDKGRPLPSTLLDVSSDSDGEDCGSESESENEGTKKVKRSKLSKSSSSSSSTSDDIDYSILEKDLDFETDPMEECLRIFNESTDVKTEDKGRLGKQLSKEEGSEEKTEDNLTTLFPGQKRRISHLVKQGNAEVPSKPVIRPYRPPTAQEVCYQRIQLAQQQAAQLAVAVQKASLSLPGEKKRIAHVPNVALSTAAKQSLVSTKTTVAGRSVTPSNDSEAPTLSLKACTLAGMASKTTSTIVPKRIAHVPSLQSASLQRPVIPTEFGAKVPTNIRQRYLNLFIDECLKFCSSSQEAFDKALSEEKVAYERSTSRNIYLNVAVNTLKKLRSLVPNSPSSTNKTSNKKVVSHEAVLGGKLAAKTSFTLNRSGSLRAEDLTGAALYRRLKEYLMTEEQLKENGYPMPHPEKPGRAVLFTAEEKKTIDSSCRICCRCGTEYMVSASGSCIRKEECVHHWGRLRKQRVPGGWETHYSCCSGAVGSPGCQVAKQHVHDGRKESLDGFVKTFEKLPTTEGYPGIYALDCEMCYTKQGLELTRVTVINSDLKVVYDTFVKPDTKVVDYNTRFSGVTEEDLENTSITLRDVQAVLLNMFSADTILIGHSLESDLFALKLIHGTVVDTAIVFPHRLGLPYKRALRTLMADYLKRIIQDNVEGHDSSEDARACMELMVWKIKEDAKVKR